MACFKISTNGETAAIPFLLFSALLHQSRDGIAFEALPVVDRDQAAAFGATVFFILFFYKIMDSPLFDAFQVVLYTHSVISSIPDIHAIDLFAGVPLAFKTEAGVCIAFYIAIDPGAIFE